jgi:hypothetical protein
VLREYSFLDNHAIYQRITIFTDLGCEDSSDWLKIPFQWPSLEDLKRKVAQKRAAGWSVVWASDIGPDPSVEELMKVVRW